jgi:transcriptional regulator NrdR family protein
MAKEVIKKDGTKQPFDSEKIKNSIRAAAGLANLQEERKNEVVEQVATTVIQMAEEKEEIATSEIREKILSELDSIEPSVSAAWRKYDQEQKGA